MSLTGEAKIVQVHPTRQCNLRCQHCYSSSAPEERERIDLELLVSALRDAKSEGYSVVSLSGGEPLLYTDLPELLRQAKRMKFATTVTSNGMLLTPKRLDNLAKHLDLLAISLDGKPESHNRMRAHPKAFATMHSRLPDLRASGVPFGFIFTLTQFNLDELDWVATFASEQGAALLQIHPLESVGRATVQLGGAAPDGVEASIAYLEAARLQEKIGDQLKIQVDLSHRQSLRQHPDRVYADQGWDQETPLADLISPLVIEPDGAVVPLQYGFSRRYALGNLHTAPLASLADRWRQATLPDFRALCHRVHGQQTGVESGQPFFNWYDEIRSASGQAATTAS